MKGQIGAYWGLFDDLSSIARGPRESIEMLDFQGSPFETLVVYLVWKDSEGSVNEVFIGSNMEVLFKGIIKTKAGFRYLPSALCHEILGLLPRAYQERYAMQIEP